MATAAHKTPERSIDEAMEDLTLAQRKKKHGPSLSRCLHKQPESVKYAVCARTILTKQL